MKYVVHEPTAPPGRAAALPKRYHVPNPAEVPSILGALIGRDGGLTAEEAAQAAGCGPGAYRSAASGETPATARMAQLATICRGLDGIIETQIVGWWWRTADPKLPGGASPLGLLSTGGGGALDLIEAVVDSYYDPSYG